ncbi:MAG: hypothetical protein GXO11_00325 [Epsilonproteobacteria bacterium]|nr:hypothetical protein [Campylobacterota bacterium]
MKKIVLSSLAALALTSGIAQASTQFYVDDNGQVFTKPAEGRKPLKETTPWYSHSDKLKFSVQTFLGYTYDDFESGKTSTGEDYKADASSFQLRRAYFQVKAYLLEDPKSYYRVTFDVHQDTKVDGSGTDGDMLLRVKYAYLYLNDILPFTGVEVGLAHRPWHDYEEHNAWYYRSISKVLVEDGNGAHLSNSADYGIMFKTKSQYFDADYGVFNGEGYHSTQIRKGMSFEWRTTAHILGVNGKDKQTKKTYWDASFFGQYNQDHKEVSIDDATRYDDLVFYGLHTVYNQPSFLIAAQYIISDDTADNSSYVSAQAGDGYSVNGEFRFGAEKEFRILGRFDSWTPDLLDDALEKEQRTYIGGFAWHQNKNVEWVANATVTDNEEGSSREKYNGTAYMITAEIKF